MLSRKDSKQDLGLGSKLVRELQGLLIDCSDLSCLVIGMSSRWGAEVGGEDIFHMGDLFSEFRESQDALLALATCQVTLIQSNIPLWDILE